MVPGGLLAAFTLQHRALALALSPSSHCALQVGQRRRAPTVHGMRENRIRLKDLDQNDRAKVEASQTDWDTIAPLLRGGLSLEDAISIGEERNRQGWRTDMTDKDAELFTLGVPLALVTRLARSNQDSREAVILLTGLLDGDLESRISVLERLETAGIPLSIAMHATRHYQMGIESIEEIARRFGPRAGLVHYAATSSGATLDDLDWLVRHGVDLPMARIGSDEWGQLGAEPDEQVRRLTMLLVIKEAMPITWARAVAVSHADERTAELLARLIADRMPLDQAVEATRALQGSSRSMTLATRGRGNDTRLPV